MFLLGVILSSIFFFLAAVPLRLVRIQAGRPIFLMLSVITVAAMIYFQLNSWAVGFAILCTCIGLYAEIEVLNISVFFSALVAILTPFASLMLVLGILAKTNNTTIYALLQTHFDVIFKELATIYPQELLEQITNYIPALSLISLMFVVFFSLAFDPSLMKSRNRREWRDFALPGFVVWILIAGLAMSFAVANIPFWTGFAKNLVMIVMAGYFFQGLSVVQAYMNHYKLSYFWRFIILVLVFTQFFPILSILGLSDYWLEYRNRLGRSKMNFAGR